MEWRRLVFLLLYTWSTHDHVSASKILIIAPSTLEGDFQWISTFVRALLDRDHHVTLFGCHRAKLRHRNYFELNIEPGEEVTIPDRYKYDLRHTAEIDNLFMSWEQGLTASELILKDPKVQRFIKHEETFDLIIFEDSSHESLLMFAYKFNCPVVMLSSHGLTTQLDIRMGMVPPLAFVPFHLSTYGSKMTYFQRIRNVALTYQYWLWREFYYLPAQQALADKYFFHIKQGPGRALPHLKSIEQNITVTLANTHMALIEPRPKMPGLIFIGGAHLKEPEKLPDRVKDFLDGARHGAIIFSFGSAMEIKNMPVGKLRIFANVFKKLKQRVLMKYEDPLVPALPPNVMTLKWLPQSDLLAHKNVVLLITSGSNLAIQEAITRTVPVLVIPFFGEQFANGKRAERGGYGLVLRFSDLSAMTLSAKITELITNSGYKERIKAVAEVFLDNLVPPMDEAMYWIDYVLTHNGVVHLKSSSIGMSWIKQALYDVYLGYTVFAVGFLFFFKKLLEMLHANRAAGYVQAKIRSSQGAVGALVVETEKARRSKTSY